MGERSEKMIARSKHEISHKALDKVRLNGINAGNDNWKMSGRFSAIIGKTVKTKTMGKAKLVDKVIFPINVCPECESTATYHHRIQQTGDQIDNVWEEKRIKSKTGLCYIKMDMCLDCFSVFPIEMYMYHKVKA